MFNSLKVHVLYRRLDYDLRHGNYPKDLFMEYVKLPRRASYVNPDYLKGETIRNHVVDLNRDFQQVNHCPPIGNDEALLRAFFLHFFIQEAPDDRVCEVYPGHVAKAGVCGGEDRQRGGGPGEVVCDARPVRLPGAQGAGGHRVRGDNPKGTGPKAVTLEVDVKNVANLIVKVYEINALNYYLDTGRR